MPRFSFCCCAGAFVVLICLYYFSVCYDKVLEGKNLSEKGLVLAHRLDFIGWPHPHALAKQCVDRSMQEMF